jgi:hypothetical protein
MSDFAQNSAQPAKHKRAGRRRLAPAALMAGVAASAAVALSMTGALGAFTAQITNSNDTAATGTLTMQEVGGAATCNSTDGTGNNVSTNTYSCTSINKYGGSTTMIPGTPVATTITIKNTGSVAANTFTLTPAACTPSLNGAVNGSAQSTICNTMTVAVSETLGGVVSNPVAAKTLTAFNTAGAVSVGPLAAGATASFTFTVLLPSTADNTFQGLGVSQNLVWNFTS